MSNKGLNLEIPKKVLKKAKNYYLPDDIIEFIKKTAGDLTEFNGVIVSENEVLIAIVNYYRAAELGS